MHKKNKKMTKKVLYKHINSADLQAAEKLVFRDRFDILLKVRLSGVAEQECTKLYGKTRLIIKKMP